MSDTENRQPITFGLLHGAWHGAWCWDLVSQELDKSGYEPVAIDMPIDNADASFADYADVAARTLEEHENIILVGHSRGANVLPRVAGLLSVKKMIYIGGSFQSPTLASLGVKAAELPERQLAGFKSGIQQIGGNMTIYDPTKAGEVFYHDCPKNLRDWAVAKLRPQRRSDDEQPLLRWPDVPQDYILCTNERVINPSWSREVCKLLGIRVHEIDSGHSPFLSRYKELSKMLASIALE